MDLTLRLRTFLDSKGIGRNFGSGPLLEGSFISEDPTVLDGAIAGVGVSSNPISLASILRLVLKTSSKDLDLDL